MSELGVSEGFLEADPGRTSWKGKRRAGLSEERARGVLGRGMRGCTSQDTSPSDALSAQNGPSPSSSPCCPTPASPCSRESRYCWGIRVSNILTLCLWDPWKAPAIVNSLGNFTVNIPFESAMSRSWELSLWSSLEREG